MVFTGIVGIISTAANRLTGAASSSVPYIAPGVSQQTDPSVGFGVANPRQKHYLRLSSSLQDFSAYRQHDPEESGIILGTDSSVYNVKPSNLLQKETSSYSFSKEKGSPRTPFVRRKWVRVFMLLLCLLVLSFLIYMIFQFFLSKSSSKYYVVLDCGSTGTRVYVYQGYADPEKGGLPITLKSLNEGLRKKSKSQSGRAYDRMESEPGLDKLVRNLPGLKAAIKPLLQWAQKQIPQNAHKSTSLFLYATAGVRRLPDADSKWLLDNAWTILNNSPFLCRKEWVKTITGMEEAYYGWIALNYGTGMLGAVPRKPTFGALDLGGSSLQVTFESTDNLVNKTSLDLRIGAVNHHLSAYSLAGYGLNDAFGKSVLHLLKKLPGISIADLVKGKVELRHPCLNSGYREKYNCLHCASSYQEAGSPLIGGKTLGKGVKEGVPVQLVGSPNWEECSALAKIVVNLSEWSVLSPGLDCELQPCALPDGLPRPSGQFYGISGFFVVYRFFNLTQEASLDDVLERGREFCEKKWEVAKNSVAPQPFIEQYCFRAPYIVSLLREGLHIVDDQVIIGSGSITWTLGVALLEAGKALPSNVAFRNYELFQMKINPVIIFSILFISLVILVCALSFPGNLASRFLRRSYLPLFRQNTASSASVLNISSPFRFQGWSPISSSDGRTKTPLSPTVAGNHERPFSMGHGFGGSSIQLMESSLYPPTSSVSHSYSSGSLGQMQFDNSSMGSLWTPNRSQMRLQSRRSQSREDLSSSVAEIGKV